MRWLADLCYLLAGLIYLPVALYHALIVGKNRHGWGERFGGVRSFDPSQQRIWIHAVSLGEINATPRLIDALRERLPRCDFVISTTTDTGYARAIQLYGKEQVFRFPLDFSLVVSRVLERVRADMIVLVELEVWYNLTRMASRRGIPVVVVNGRLTARSERRFRLLGAAGRGMFGHLTWVGAQDEAIAERFRSVGVPGDRVEVTSSLKWDTAVVADVIDGQDALAAAVGLDDAHPVWVCGSTGPGEEAMILGAFRRLLDEPALLARRVHGETGKVGASAPPILAIVPRKPERFDEVARLIERAGYTCVRRSQREDGTSTEIAVATSVVLGDTMGELRKFYSLAAVTFVGRSLVPMGGSDPMEVAALGKPVVVGPHTENFRMPVEAFQAVDAIRILETAGDLAPVVGGLLGDPALAGELGKRARAVVVRNQGATMRTAAALACLLDASENVSAKTSPRVAASRHGG